MDTRNISSSRQVKNNRRNKIHLGKSGGFNFQEPVVDHNMAWRTGTLSNGGPIAVASDGSYATPFPMHMAYSMDPYQLQMYPSMFQITSPPPMHPVPPRRKYRRGGTPIKLEDRNGQYASLQPNDYKIMSPKSSDSDSNSKRHFSDPGMGAASSCESDHSCESLTNPLYITLTEEVHGLRERCSQIATELARTNQEINQFKLLGCGKCSNTNTPGTIIDAVAELRSALHMRDEAVLHQADEQTKLSSANITQQISALSQRMMLLEEQLLKFTSREFRDVCVSTSDTTETEPAAVRQESTSITTDPDTSKPPDAFVLIRDLQKKNDVLEKELEDAKASRTEAEAHSNKLERLVGVLRNKIQTLSEDVSLPAISEAQTVKASVSEQQVQREPADAAVAKVRDAAAGLLNGGGGSLNSRSTPVVFESVEAEKMCSGRPAPPVVPPRPPPRASPQLIPGSNPTPATSVIPAMNAKPVALSPTNNEFDSSKKGAKKESAHPAITLTGPVTEL